jgi:hypothetical protein
MDEQESLCSRRTLNENYHSQRSMALRHESNGKRKNYNTILSVDLMSSIGALASLNYTNGKKSR